MRKTFAAGIIAALIALAVPQISSAFCASYAVRTSSRGVNTIKGERFVVVGTIDSAVPKDAHGKYSFYLRVRKAYLGKAPARMLITDYGDYQFKSDPKGAGSSAAASVAFVKKYAGQPAVVSATNEERPFKNQFQTSDCKYSAFGKVAAATFIKELNAIFAPKTAPAVSPPKPGKAPVQEEAAAPARVSHKPAAPTSRAGVIIKAMMLLAVVGGAIAFFGRGRLYGRPA